MPAIVADLTALLLELFNTQELLRFLERLPDTESLCLGLPAPSVEFDRFAQEAAASLKRHGLIREELFDALERERPHQHTKIRALRTRTDLSPRAPRAPPPYASRTDPVLDLFLLRLVVNTLAAESADPLAIYIDLGLDPEHIGPLRTRDLIALDGRKQIQRLCSRGVFRRQEDAKRFFTLLVPPIRWPKDLNSHVDGLRERRELLAETATGGALRNALTELCDRAVMEREWARIVQRIRETRRREPEAPRDRKTMLEIYFKAQILWDRRKMNLFTRSDFDQEIWEELIVTPQATGSRYHELDHRRAPVQNHLHHANNVIGDELGRYLSPGDPGAQRRAPQRRLVIVEGGAGGLNTTHQVLARVIHARQRSRLRPFSDLLYRGFEVNRHLRTTAEDIIRGRYQRPDILGRNTDPRAAFFSGLGPKHHIRLRPIGGDLSFVDCTDMFNGFGRLEQELRDDRMEADAVVLSYSFHHVPNGRALRAFLFREDADQWSEVFESNPTLRPIDPVKEQAFARTVLEMFARALDGSPPAPLRGDERTRWASHHATSLWKLIPWDFASLGDTHRWYAEDLRKRLRAGPAGVASFFLNPPRWLRELLQDYQKGLVRKIREILRPGGLLAIADPDGFSKFNWVNLPENSEMGVAHFLSARQLRELLVAERFVIESMWEQMRRVTSGSEQNEQPFELADWTTGTGQFDRRRHGIEDDALGYIVIARKPTSNDPPLRNQLLHAPDRAPFT